MDILERLKCLAEESGTKTAFKSVYGSVSYEELWRRSGVLAELICERMKDNKDPVVVYGHKDPTMIICFIACVRSGRAYCPVDISMPADRIAAIIETIGEPLILIAEKNVPDDAGLLSEDGGTPLYPNTICYDEITQYTSADEKAAVVSNSMRVKGDDVFYIIFTSGTTGKPKGVQITTDNLNNYLNWAVTLAGGIEDGSVFLNQAPYSFDLSVMDLYPALAVGGTVASVDKAMQQETALMLPYIAEQGIHYWVSKPSFA
ncbi:MAG: D-alanine--poly(phosphoribitol) ligase subunit DltA, partial [Clostridiales bacterium]|nr:D-alanine--poly(phosphoribitol) ligase subunit DltA [Clostridiales bacterium]